MNGHSRSRTVVAALVGFAVFMVGRGVASGRPPAPGAAEVKIDNFVYGPAELTVAAGTTVTWSNQDDLPHTVTSDDKSFTSKALDTDQKFSHTFTTPGTYPYYCTIHPKMTAKVIVK